MATNAFTIDPHDAENASNGYSRYAAYLRDHVKHFMVSDYDGETPTTDAAEFAHAAFIIGQSPIMAPPYVIPHRLVLRSTPHWDERHRPAMNIDLAMPELPAVVAMLTQSWTGWDTTRSGRFIEPDRNDRSSAFATLTLRVTYDEDVTLPAPRYNSDNSPDWETCQAAVAALVTHLNKVLKPFVQMLDVR